MKMFQQYMYHPGSSTRSIGAAENGYISYLRDKDLGPGEQAVTQHRTGQGRKSKIRPRNHLLYPM